VEGSVDHVGVAATGRPTVPDCDESINYGRKMFARSHAGFAVHLGERHSARLLA
jgi:hypothetical protein